MSELFLFVNARSNAWWLTVNHGKEGHKGIEMVREKWREGKLSSRQFQEQCQVCSARLNSRELAALSILSAVLFFPHVHCPLLLTSISACAKFIRLLSVCAAHNGSSILLALKGSAKGPGLTQQWVFSVSGVGSLLTQPKAAQCFH